MLDTPQLKIYNRPDKISKTSYIIFCVLIIENHPLIHYAPRAYNPSGPPIETTLWMHTKLFLFNFPVPLPTSHCNGLPWRKCPSCQSQKIYELSVKEHNIPLSSRWTSQIRADDPSSQHNTTLKHNLTCKRRSSDSGHMPQFGAADLYFLFSK